MTWGGDILLGVQGKMIWGKYSIRDVRGDFAI